MSEQCGGEPNWWAVVMARSGQGDGSSLKQCWLASQETAKRLLEKAKAAPDVFWGCFAIDEFSGAQIYAAALEASKRAGVSNIVFLTSAGDSQALRETRELLKREEALGPTSVTVEPPQNMFDLETALALLALAESWSLERQTADGEISSRKASWV